MSSVGDLGTQSGALKKRVVLHRNWNCEENADANALATAFSLRTIIDEKHGQNQGKKND
jgi:hypothetical protein